MDHNIISQHLLQLFANMNQATTAPQAQTPPITAPATAPLENCSRPSAIAQLMAGIGQPVPENWQQATKIQQPAPEIQESVPLTLEQELFLLGQAREDLAKAVSDFHSAAGEMDALMKRLEKVVQLLESGKLQEQVEKLVQSLEAAVLRSENVSNGQK